MASTDVILAQRQDKNKKSARIHRLLSGSECTLLLRLWSYSSIVIQTEQLDCISDILLICIEIPKELLYRYNIALDFFMINAYVFKVHVYTALHKGITFLVCHLQSFLQTNYILRALFFCSPEYEVNCNTIFLWVKAFPTHSVFAALLNGKKNTLDFTFIAGNCF